MASVLVGAAVLGAGTPSVAAIAAALLVPTVVAAGTALLVTWLRGNGPRVDLGLVWSWRDVGLGLGFGFGGLTLTAIAGAVYVWIVGPDASSAVGDIFDGQRSGLLAALLIGVIVVVIAPVCEEIIYRGLLWGALEKLGAGPWVAFGATTVVFAVAHFELTRARCCWSSRSRSGWPGSSPAGCSPASSPTRSTTCCPASRWCSACSGSCRSDVRGVWQNGGSAPRPALYRAAATSRRGTRRP